MSKVNVTAEEVLWSINRFDKIAVQMMFGMSLVDIQQSGDDSELIRALAFIQMRRDGAKDDEAREASFALTLRELTEYFSEPSQESGKDSTA